VDEEANAWDQLVEATDSRSGRSDSTPRTGTRARSGSHKRLAAQPPGAGPADRRMLWWILGGAAAACVLAGVLIWWALRPKPEAASTSTGTNAAPTYIVTDQRPPASDVVSNLDTALKRIKQRPKVGGRIILEQDVAEEVRIEDLENVTIEAREGQAVTWKPPPNGTTGKLLTLQKTPNFHLRGLALDGQGREEALVSVFGNCHGTTLDDVVFRSFRRCGVWITNCKGEESPDRHVVFSRLRIDTTGPQQCGFYFDLNPRMRDVYTNEYIALRGCTVAGKATAKVRAKSPEAVAKVDLGPLAGALAIDQ
jgi:hypothetical protein